MRVAFVSFDFGEYCIRLANALTEFVNLRLWLPYQLAEPHLSKLEQRVDLRVFKKPRLRQVFRQLAVNWRLSQELRQFHPDVIHLQAGHLWFNLTLPRVRQYPLVVTIHDPRHHLGDHGSQKTPQRILDFGYRRGDQVVVHVRSMARMVAEELGIAREKVHVIPHVQLGEEAEDHDIPEDENLILFFGRIWAYKGLEYLIRAEPLIHTEMPAARIMIAGSGASFDPYRRIMESPNRFIVRNEYIPPGAETADLFRRASVVVLPYVEATQSGVIPMAYTYGKPVVATDVGGLPEQVEHERTGLVVPARDEKALAKSVVRLLKDRSLRRRLGASGKRKADREWSPKAIAQRTIGVYEAAIASRRVG